MVAVWLMLSVLLTEKEIGTALPAAALAGTVTLIWRTPATTPGATPA